MKLSIFLFALFVISASAASLKENLNDSAREELMKAIAELERDDGCEGQKRLGEKCENTCECCGKSVTCHGYCYRHQRLDAQALSALYNAFSLPYCAGKAMRKYTDTHGYT